MSDSLDYSLAELMIVAAARVWRDNGEVLATGIGTGPRLAAGLARLAYNAGLMLTDGEAYLVESPVPMPVASTSPSSRQTRAAAAIISSARE